jgi:hypothetical protein
MCPLHSAAHLIHAKRVPPPHCALSRRVVCPARHCLLLLLAKSASGATSSSSSSSSSEGKYRVFSLFPNDFSFQYPKIWSAMDIILQPSSNSVCGGGVVSEVHM